MRKKAHIEEKK